ncbi:hypothetical protein AB4254_08920 [Vibrio breoganii]
MPTTQNSINNNIKAVLNSKLSLGILFVTKGEFMLLEDNNNCPIISLCSPSGVVLGYLTVGYSTSKEIFCSKEDFDNGLLSSYLEGGSAELLEVDENRLNYLRSILDVEPDVRVYLLSSSSAA